MTRERLNELDQSHYSLMQDEIRELLDHAKETVDEAPDILAERLFEAAFIARIDPKFSPNNERLAADARAAAKAFFISKS